MSAASQSKDSKIDFILLAVAGILIVGLFVFSSSGDDKTHGVESSSDQVEQQAQGDGPKDQTDTSDVTRGASVGGPVTIPLTAPPEAKTPAPAPPNVIPVVSAQDPRIAQLQKELKAAQDQIANLQASAKASSGLMQEDFKLKAEVYQARYEDLLIRVNDLTKGLSNAMGEHDQKFSGAQPK